MGNKEKEINKREYHIITAKIHTNEMKCLEHPHF